MTDAKRILIYTSGDKMHGMGHVCRSLVLGRELKARGAEVRYLTPADTPGARRIEEVGAAFTTFLPGQALSSLRADGRGSDTLVVDVEHGPTGEWLKRIKAYYPRVVVIGGVGYGTPERADYSKYADLEVYQSILRDEPERERVLSGVRYMMIDPRYAALKPDLEGPIVVSMGGSDPHHLTEIAAGGLAKVYATRIILGPARTGGIVLPHWANGKMEVVYAPPDLLDFLSGAALTVCALGMTAYESLAAGVPVVLTSWSVDHLRTAQALEREGVALNLGLWSEFTADDARAGADWWFYKRAFLRSMSKRAKALVDGYGAARVAERILAL